ncbi:hypothetical protein GCM10009616_00110 [Microlunatus lacustris]
MTNITSEYATLPARLGLKGMRTGYGRIYTTPNLHQRPGVASSHLASSSLLAGGRDTNVQVQVTNGQTFN